MKGGIIDVDVNLEEREVEKEGGRERERESCHRIMITPAILPQYHRVALIIQEQPPCLNTSKDSFAQAVHGNSWQRKDIPVHLPSYQ